MRDFLSRAAANIKEAHKKWQWVLNMEMVGKFVLKSRTFSLFKKCVITKNLLNIYDVLKCSRMQK